MGILKKINYGLKPMLWNVYNNHKNLIIPAVAFAIWSLIGFGLYAVILIIT